MEWVQDNAPIRAAAPPRSMGRAWLCTTHSMFQDIQLVQDLHKLQHHTSGGLIIDHPRCGSTDVADVNPT